jgi:uncharacterized RDD family membrane protein YckC
VTQANDDSVRIGPPPAGGPVRAPVPPQVGGPPHGGPPPFPGPQQPYAYYGPPRQPYGYYGPPQQYGWRPPPAPLAPDGRPLADFGTRLLAHLIDGAILSGIAMVVLLPVFVVFMFKVVDFPDPAQTYGPGQPVFPDFVGFMLPILLLDLGILVLMLAGYYVYYVEMMFRSGQTVGKKLMKVKVIPIEPGVALTRGMAAKRYLIEFIGGALVPFFTYVDGLWQLWDKPYQQTLHDKVAKTVVVKVAP